MVDTYIGPRYKHIFRKKRVDILHGMSFEEIIMEHQFLVDLSYHNQCLGTTQEPHSGRDKIPKTVKIPTKINSGDETPDNGTIPQPEEDTKDGDSKSNSKIGNDFLTQFLNNYSKIRPIINNIKSMTPNSDQYLDIFEDLIFISYVIMHCEDPNILFGILLTILKKHYKGSLSGKLMRLVSEICFERPAPRPHSADYRMQVNNIMNFRNTILFNKIADALSMCITFGFIEPKNITIKSLTLFKMEAYKVGDNAVDFLSYVVELLLYFFDMGHRLFHGDYSRVFDCTELSKIDDDLVHLQTYISAIQIGSYTQQTGKQVEDYHGLLMETIDSLKKLSAGITDKNYKSLVLSKLTTAYKILVTFDQSKPLTGLREAPFSLCFYGASSVGKSTAAKMVLTNVLQFNDKACDDEHICVIQPTDKFYSTYKAYITGVIIDDLCNTRHDKAVVDPASLLISLINNIPFYAPKAEAHEKGKISVRPSVVVVTSNVKDLEANIWSNEPISVVRRLKYHIEVIPREEYTTNRGLDSSKVPEDEVRNLKENGIQDLWRFNVRYVERYLKGNVEGWKFTTVTHDGKLLESLDIYDLVAFLNMKSKQHFEEQKNFVTLCKDSGLKHKNCKTCCYPCSRCKCPKDRKVDALLEEETTLMGDAGDGVSTMTDLPELVRESTMSNNSHSKGYTSHQFSDAMDLDVINLPPDTRVDGAFFSAIDKNCDYWGTRLAEYLIYKWGKVIPGFIETNVFNPVLKLAVLKYLQNNYLSLVNYIPYTMRETNLYKSLHVTLNRYRLYRVVGVTLGLSILPTSYCLYKYDRLRASYVCGAGILSSVILYRYTYSNIIHELRSAPLVSIVPYIQQQQALVTVFKVGVSVSIAIMALKTFRSFYKTMRDYARDSMAPMPDTLLQGNLSPTKYEDITERDNEINCWAKTSESFVPNSNTRTMTAPQLVNVIKPNVLKMILELDEQHGFTIGCLALKSNVFCCPLHFFKVNNDVDGKWIASNVKPYDKTTSTYYKVRLVKHDGLTGNYFDATIDHNDIVRVGDLDLCVFKIYSGGSFPDICKYFNYQEGQCSTITLKRNMKGELIENTATIISCETSYKVDYGFFQKKIFRIQGGRASYMEEPKCGDCMMVHISCGLSPSIVGFHISGSDNSKIGSYTMFTTAQLQDALSSLDNKHKIFTPHSGSVLPLNRLGTIIKVDPNIPETAPARYVKNHNYILRGTVDVQATYYSEIRPTFMCSTVEKIFGVDNIYGGPKFGPKRYMPFYTFLSSTSGNSKLMDSSILKLSMDDYVNPLIETMMEYNKHEKMKPLTHHEIINGIPGKRFIDHINFNSAIGYPLKGKKSKHMSGEPTNYDFAQPELFEIEFENMKTKYLNNERYYPIFKASLKDEPVAKTKDKVRVFQAADITLQYAWRKYGLPILRFLSLYPLMSECAVGINPYSDEWQQLYDHLTFNGTNKDRIVAGDYKFWDQKLPSQLVMAAFEVFVRLAERIPTYTQEDILMIKGLATDTTYYLSHFNGTLIEFNSGLPSGHNLTAHINSIANALLQRYAYYLYRNPAPFRKYCRNITYGDDFENGVSPIIKAFNHLIYREVVASLDMTLTMPDKTSEATAFLHVDDCDFLKRRSVLCDIDGKYYGALDFKSMLRSLFVRGKTSVGDRDHAYSVIKGFVHDLSYHERSFYDVNILKVRELLSKISMPMPEAHFSYDEYYQHRNRKLEWWQYSEDAIDGAIYPPDYPVTPEASGSDVSSDYYVSSSSQSSINECDMDHGKPLTNNITRDSYSSAKVLSEVGDRIPRDERVHAEVYATSEDNLQNNLVTTGTAVLTSSAEHSMQALQITSTDMLSLRQDKTRDLEYYLSRPRRIATINPLTQSTPLSIAPLFSFLSITLIRDKIRNYAYINAVLHIKIVVVGSPTMAGSQIIALHPWFARDNGLGALNFNDPYPDLAQLSQLPSVVTDLSREKGGEISLPIICPSNGLDITRIESIQDAFALHYLPITTTRIPGTSNISPEISIYAWLTDVSLTGTTLAAELPQSGEYGIANEDKPPSDHVSIKENIAHATGTIVGKATEIGVNAALSAVGFSNPNSQDGVGPIVPRISNNLACYNAPTNIDCLGGDYKNEVLLDTKQLGYEDPDHMNLNNILSRWTIVDVLTIPTGNSVGPTACFSLPVTPMACFVTTASNSTVFTPTALSMAALPFNRWRGTITYRFQAVGTAFMKGKIKISHDVRSPSNVSEVQKFDTQVLNSVIWDLATTNIIEIKVPWASNQVFKTCGLLRRATHLVDPNGNVPADVDANGSLLLNQFTVLNDNGETGIGIIVSIKGEEGMVFGDMRAVLANYTFAGIDKSFTGDAPQSGEYSNIPLDTIDFGQSNEYILRFYDGTFLLITPIIWNKLITRYYNDHKDDQAPHSMVYSNELNNNILTGDKPGALLAININGLEENLTDHDTLAMICMGEKWHSVRQIIKRYTHNWTRNISPPVAVQSFYRIRLPDRPIIKGFQGNASLNVQPNNVPVTYARDSFLSFYSMAFLGYRGSLRHKLYVFSSHNSTTTAIQDMFSVSRTTSGYVEQRVNIGAVSTSTTPTSISLSASAIPSMPDARAGAAIGHSGVNPVLEYSTPFYSRGKFCWAQDRYPQILKDSPDGGYDVPWHQIIVHQYSNAALARTRIDKYIAAGDDFSLFFYLYGPRMVLDQPISHPQG
uniref:Polyprotein n=1 Tax=Biomphalaria pfeifferi virus 4 TaxID=2884322 RepID=A0A8K1P8F8_9VIRU|nr:MAG: polyprotein [Biomphalaria pfeifferi virus 4]